MPTGRTAGRHEVRLCIARRDQRATFRRRRYAPVAPAGPQVVRPERWAARRPVRWRIEMKEMLMRFVREEEGQDLVEYALLITFIALACIVGMQQLGTAINNRYQSISSSLTNAS